MPRPVNPSPPPSNGTAPARASSQAPGEAADRLWTLRSLDPEVSLEILGQYPIEVREIRDSRLDEIETAGPEAPVVLSAGTGTRRLGASTEFRSLHYDDDIRPALDRWRGLRDPDPRLGRHVRVRLEAPGATIEGKVRSVDLLIGSAWVTGLPRFFNVSFEVVEDGGGLEIETEAPTVRETTWITLGAIETYEHVAARLLGDPNKGPLIRFINPEHADKEGQVREQGSEERLAVRIRVFEPEHPLMRRPVRPRSLYLGAREDFPRAYADRLRELAEQHGPAGAGSRSLRELFESGELEHELVELLP